MTERRDDDRNIKFHENNNASRRLEAPTALATGSHPGYKCTALLLLLQGRGFMGSGLGWEGRGACGWRTVGTSVALAPVASTGLPVTDTWFEFRDFSGILYTDGRSTAPLRLFTQQLSHQWLVHATIYYRRLWWGVAVTLSAFHSTLLKLFFTIIIITRQ